MSFIQREIDKISSELLKKLNAGEGDTPQYRELYTAQQALCWALEPSGVLGPLKLVIGHDPAERSDDAPKPLGG